MKRSLVITVKLLFIEHTLGNLPSDSNNNHNFLNEFHIQSI